MTTLKSSLYEAFINQDLSNQRKELDQGKVFTTSKIELAEQAKVYSRYKKLF